MPWLNCGNEFHLVTIFFQCVLVTIFFQCVCVCVLCVCCVCVMCVCVCVCISGLQYFEIIKDQKYGPFKTYFLQLSSKYRTLQSIFGTQTMLQLYPIILPYHFFDQCSNSLFKQIQSVIKSEIHIFSSTAV